MILCANPQAQYLAQKEEILEAVERTFGGNNYILGSEVATFENAFAQYNGCRHAVGVNSGTDALVLALRAYDIGAGDEVITVSHTALATVSAILATGATPVIVDVDPEFYTINVEAVQHAVTTKTKAIIAVHLYGQAADLAHLLSLAEKAGVPLIEDCAQSTGGRYQGQRTGSLGDVGCFSFYPTKNLGAIGDGGAVITNNTRLAERIGRLRQYGWDPSRQTQEPGLNSRLDEVQAAILNVKLKTLDAANDKRRLIAKMYSEALMGLPLTTPKVRPKTEHAYHLYVVTTENHKTREELKNFLATKKVMAGVHYPTPAHKHVGYDKKCVFKDSQLSVTNQLSETVLSLPMYPELTIDEVQTVIISIKEFF